jgi:hypothetical protein
VTDVSHYPRNSWDNLVDSICSECNNIRTLVVLVSADAEEDDDSWLRRIEKFGSQSTGIGIQRRIVPHLLAESQGMS